MNNNKKPSNTLRNIGHDNKNDRRIICEVVHLDNALPNLKLNIKIGENGGVLFNKVCDTFGGILEKDYFGLKYADKHGQAQWLELNKSISKQIKEKSHGVWIQVFSFRFKHYPRDPFNDLKQDLSKYLLYLQLRQDLFCGRLIAAPSDQYRFAALILQAESEGDILDEDTIQLAELHILPTVNPKDEDKIMTVYETFRDLEPFEAEKLFIEESSKLDTYGVERVAVKDQKENDLFVGITFEGVTTFSESRKLHTFPWKTILKMSFSHKLFMLKVIVEKKDHILGFKCESSHAASALWKMALDRKWFITLERATEARRSRSGGSLFRRKLTHTFSGRSQRELATSCQTLQGIPQPKVNRTHSMMTILRSSHSRSESANVTDHLPSNGSTGYYTLPLSQEDHSCLSESSDGGFSVRGAKDSYGRNKASPAKLGTTLDFMEPVTETPSLGRKSIQGSDTELNVQDIDSNCDVSERINLDDESNLYSEMIEIIEREQESLLLTSPPEPNPSEEAARLDKCDESQSSDIKTQSSTLTPVIYSVLFICASILFGIVRYLYVKNTE